MVQVKLASYFILECISSVIPRGFIVALYILLNKTLRACMHAPYYMIRGLEIIINLLYNWVSTQTS